MAFLKAFEASLEFEDEKIREIACDVAVELSQTVGATFCVICPAILDILNRNLNSSVELKYSTLEKLNESLELGSNIFKSFEQYSNEWMDAILRKENSQVNFLFNSI